MPGARLFRAHFFVSPQSKGTTKEDFLNFEKMLTPLTIKILFWVGVVLMALAGLASIISGIGADYGGGKVVMSGLLMIVLGPVIVRIYCELLNVIFSVNDTLTDIKNFREEKQG